MRPSTCKDVTLEKQAEWFMFAGPRLLQQDELEVVSVLLSCLLMSECEMDASQLLQECHPGKTSRMAYVC